MEQARPGSLEPAHDASVTWRYMAPTGHTIEMVQEPGYFRNSVRECSMSRIANRHAWNKIEVIAEDGSFEVELRVVSVDKDALLVHTRTIREWQAETKKAAAAPPANYTVEHVQGNGWRALDPNSTAVTEKRTTRDEALAAAVAHHNKAKGQR